MPHLPADARLRPQRTAAWVSVTCALVSVLLAAVFFMVPRGVTVGTPVFVPHNWHRNRTLGTYELHLGVHVPVYNADYFPVRSALPARGRLYCKL